MPLQKTERVPQREGEDATRVCNVCHELLPIEQFYVRTIPKSKRKEGEKRGRKPEGKSARKYSCARCENDRVRRHNRLKWLRSLTLAQLQEEQRKGILYLQAIGEVIVEKASQ